MAADRREDARYFIALLDAFAREAPPPCRPDADWEALTDWGERHGVAGILGFVADHMPADGGPPPAVRQRLTERWQQTVVTLARQEYATEELLAAFDRGKLSRVPMKGYVLREYYPVPELRTFGDVDLLIREEDRERADELMRREGFACTDKSGTVYTYRRGPYRYELHTRLIPDGFSRIDPDRLPDPWEHTVQADGPYGYRFAPSFHLLYLLLHLCKHLIGNGAGVRMWLDIALLLRRETELDWGWIRQYLQELRLTAFADAVFGICQRWFHTPPPYALSPLPEETYAALAREILQAGTFGKTERNMAVSRLRQQTGRGGDRGARLRALGQFVFPPYRQLKGQYPFLEGRPWLLPVGWCRRYADGVFHRRKKAAGILHGLFREGDAARAQYRLFSELGLTGEESPDKIR